jgi:hypothetical protein
MEYREDEAYSPEEMLYFSVGGSKDPLEFEGFLVELRGYNVE